MSDRHLFMKYFVLNPSKKDIFGKASRKAMNQYARTIRKDYPVFAEQIEAWVAREELDMSKTFNNNGVRDTR